MLARLLVLLVARRAYGCENMNLCSLFNIGCPSGPSPPSAPPSPPSPPSVIESAIQDAINSLLDGTVKPAINGVLAGAPSSLALAIDLPDMPNIQSCALLIDETCVCYNNISTTFGLDSLTGFNTVTLAQLEVDKLDVDFQISDFLSAGNLIAELGVVAASSPAVFGANGSIAVGLEICVIGNSQFVGDLRLSLTAELVINATSSITSCTATGGGTGIKPSFDFNITFHGVGLQNPVATLDTSALSGEAEQLLLGAITAITDGITAVVDAVPDSVLSSAINAAGDFVENLIQNTVDTVLPDCISFSTAGMPEA
jgi:hypothetical protein